MMAMTSAAWVGLLVSIVWFAGVVTGAGDKYHRFCYLDTAAQSREGAGRLMADGLGNVTLCTHLVFVGAVVDPVEADLAPVMQDDIHHYEVLTGLKKTHPELKVLLLVGGPDTSHSALFSQAVNATDNIDRLATNVLNYLLYHRFDGIEIDWRYPGLFGSIEDDIYRFSVLVRKLRETFANEASSSGIQRLMLNVRVSGDKDLLKKTVQVEEVARYADYIVVTAYDFYEAESIIGHNSGLYGRKGDHQAFTALNADYVVQYLTEFSGLLPDQIVLGIPAYGRSTFFINETLQGFGLPHDGPGSAGPYTKTTGLLAYYEICLLISDGWTEVVNGEQMAAFAFNNEQIVTYDSVVSVVNKANYIKDTRLAGAALWDLSTDDFSGSFCQQGPFPLTAALMNTLTGPRSKCPPGEHGELDTEGCVPCPFGTYQPSPNTMTCLSCPEGLTTLSEASEEPYKCILPCPSGTEFNPVTSSCDPCPLGYIREEGLDPACIKCPPGFTTVASSSSDCVRSPDGVPETEPRQIDVKATMTFVTTSCENKPVIVGAVRMLVNDYFRRLSRHWSGLCNDADCSNVISDVTKGCEGGSVNLTSRRKRRQAEEKLVVSILFANVSDEVNTTDITRRTQSVLATVLSERAEFTPLSTYGIRFAKLESLETTQVCETGSAVNNGRCEPCGAGSIHNVTSGTCTPCPAGQFQPLAGQTSCTQCPGVMSTREPGATSSDLCISPCDARPNFCYNGGLCHWTEADRGSVYCECRHQYQGERCTTPTGVATASNTGTMVGAIVGGILAFLVVVLIIIACCVCFRIRKAVKLQRVNDRSNSVHSNNHYMTWGTFSKAGARGVKFVDYVDYYMWLSNASDPQPPIQTSYRKPKGTSQQSSLKSQTTMTMTTAASDPLPQAASVNYSNANGTNMAETNVDKSDHDDHVY